MTGTRRIWGKKNYFMNELYQLIIIVKFLESLKLPFIAVAFVLNVPVPVKL